VAKRDRATNLKLAAQMLGKRGGKKGGPARARMLTHDERVKIASAGGHAKAAQHGGKKKGDADK